MIFNHKLYNSGNTETEDKSFDGSIYPPYEGSSEIEPNSFPSLLPIAIRIAAKTIGLDLVSVQPMEHSYSYEAERRKRKREQRKKKIEEIFPEMKKHEK
jgi:hypothetical protein